MAGFSEHLAAAKGEFLWLADTDYATRLLAGGSAPWLDVAALIAWRRQAHALLRPMVTVLDAAPLVAAWLGHHLGLRQAVIAEQRPAEALGLLLSDAGLRDHVRAVLKGLKLSYAQQPLALLVPSPSNWPMRLAALLHGRGVELDAESIEDAAMNLADFLRALGQESLDVLVLAEADDAAARDDDLYELYDPVFNISRHYRWAVGLDHTQLGGPAACDAPVDFIIGDGSAGKCAGLDVSAAVWGGGGVPSAPDGGFRYMKIPAEAEPEQVLRRLALLRR